MKEVFWIASPDKLPTANLAIVLRPRGGDWLEDELLRISRSGVQIAISMLEESEAASLGLADEGRLAEQVGLSFLSFPIADRETPSELAVFEEFVSRVAARIRAGEHVGVHCRGSIGRASIMAACTLIRLGWEPKQALAAIESARGCNIPDTEEQRDWILSYKAKR